MISISLRSAIAVGVTGVWTGFGEKNHQTPNPALGAESQKVWANARTCPVQPIKIAGRSFFPREHDACPENSNMIGVHDHFRAKKPFCIERVGR
jgi:hypothetical protein